MTMILCTRSKFGIAIVADKRNHLNINGVSSHQDTITKFVNQGRRIIYNHGYNLIDGVYWAEREQTLLPDGGGYCSIIARDMMEKPDRTAGYVFVTKTATTEVVIDAGKDKPTITSHGRFIRSGSGTKYLDFDAMMNHDDFWKNLVPGAMLKNLRVIFEEAYQRQVAEGSNDFSHDHDTAMIVF